jgi:uncharacterized membrane protein (UPF0127 family)
MTERRTRRRFLQVAGALGVGGLVGCAGDDSDGTPTRAESGPAGTATPPPERDDTAAATPSPTTASDSSGGSTVGPTTAGTRTPSETAATTGTPTATPTATDVWTPSASAPPNFESYEQTAVRVESPDGERLGAVRAAIADTSTLRYRGLSDTDSMPDDWGMLFVYDAVGDHTYVMRRMDFGLDIVYVADDGEITTIHHAPEPGPDEDGNDQTYPGRGQYVLEVNYEWTTERGVEEGDFVRFEL